MEDNNKEQGFTYYEGSNGFSNMQEPVNSGYQYHQDTAQDNMQSGVQQGGSQKPKKEKKPSNGTGKKVAGVIFGGIAFGLIAGCVMFSVNFVGNKLFGQKGKLASTTEIATVSTANDKQEAGTGNVADVAENVMPSIVSVTNTSVQTVRSWFQSYEEEVTGAGSGIIIGQTDDEILVATNYHVINGAKEITITFCDETSVAATIKGVDKISDLAVVSVKAKDMDSDTLAKVKVAAIGSSENLRVGEEAIAIGNALGYGQSVTVGYISALERDVDTEDGTMIKMLQTDAAINPGNSGGALLNSKGEVIGINSAKYVDGRVEGMGYAIPISDAIPIINDLMNQKVIAEDEQGYLGIQGNDITDEYSQGFNMPKGVYVVKILDDSPANKCGLKAGDIITKLAGREISSMESLQSILSTKKAGEEIKMVIQRNNEKGEYEEVELNVVLGAKKDMPQGTDDESDDQDLDESENEEQMIPDDQEIPDDFLDEFEYFFGR